MLQKTPGIVAVSFDKPLYSLVPSTLSGTPRSLDSPIASGNSDVCSPSLAFIGRKSKRSTPSTDLVEIAGKLLANKDQRASKRRPPPPALLPSPHSLSPQSMSQCNIDAVSSLNTVINPPFTAEADPNCLHDPLSTLALSPLPFFSSPSSPSPSISLPQIDTGATDADEIVKTPKPLRTEISACKPQFGEALEPAAPLASITHIPQASSLPSAKRSSTSSTSSISSSSSSSSSLTTKPILFINNIAPNIPRPKPAASAYVQTQSAIQQKARKQLREEGKIKRSSNCFIMYRTHMHPFIVARYGNQNNKEISRLAGRCWRNEPEAVKAIYRQKAQTEKQKHAALYPSYKYTPARPCQLKGNNSSSSSTSKGATDTTNISSLSETNNCRPVNPENASNQDDIPTRKQLNSAQRSRSSLSYPAHKTAERQFTVTETPLHDFMGDSDLKIQKPHASKNRPHRPPPRRIIGNSSNNNIINRPRQNNILSESASAVSMDVSLSMNSHSLPQSSHTPAIPLTQSLDKKVSNQVPDSTVAETLDASMTFLPIIIDSIPYDSPLSPPLYLAGNSNEETDTNGSSSWDGISNKFPEPLPEESWSILGNSQGFEVSHETSDPMATLIHGPMDFQLTTTGDTVYEHELKFMDEPTFYPDHDKSQIGNIQNWTAQHSFLRGQGCSVLTEWEAQTIDSLKISSAEPSIHETTVVSNNHYQGFPWQHLSAVSEPSSTLDFEYGDLIMEAMTEPGMATLASIPVFAPPPSADASPTQSAHSSSHDASATIATSCIQTQTTTTSSLNIPVISAHTHGELVPQTTAAARTVVDTKMIDAMDASPVHHEQKDGQNDEWTFMESTNPLSMSEIWPTCHLPMASLGMFPLSNQPLYTLSDSSPSSAGSSSSPSICANYLSAPPGHGIANSEFTELKVAAAPAGQMMQWAVPGRVPVVTINGNSTSSNDSSYSKAPWITHIPLQDKDPAFDSNAHTCSDEELSRSIQYYERLVEQKKMRLSLQRHWKQQQQLLQQQQQLQL